MLRHGVVEGFTGRAMNKPVLGDPILEHGAQIPRLHRGRDLWSGVQIAVSGADIQRVLRHRYEVYLTDRGPDYPGLDHGTKTLRDPEDEGAIILYARDASSAVVASMRIMIQSRENITDSEQRSFFEFLELHPDKGRGAKLARMCVSDKRRATPQLLRMMLMAYFFGINNGVRAAFLQSREQTQSLYERLGYRALGPARGGLINMAIDLRNWAGLKETGSPYLPILSLREPAPTARHPKENDKMHRASAALQPLIQHSQILLSELLVSEVPETGVRQDQYVRYLRMQYHLTKGVQWYFMSAAAHPSLSSYRRLRQFLFEFANEEELHYEVAENDLRMLNETTGKEPLDVCFWHAHFKNVVQNRPFVRLGAAAILENASAGPVKAKLKQALSSPFLNRANTKFIVLHQHETLPHGEQILAALDSEKLTAGEISDLIEGAQTGTVLFYRMVEWAIAAKSLSHFAA